MVVAGLLLSCADHGSAEVPDAEAPAQTQRDRVDEAEQADADVCPRPVHPDYCRRTCRSFVARMETLHAKRMRFPTQAGLGTCGEYFVFTEREIADDGGFGRSLTEYYDRSSALAGSVDERRAPCERFGVTPTCTPRMHWFRRGERVRDPHAEIERLRKERDLTAAP